MNDSMPDWMAMLAAVFLIFGLGVFSVVWINSTDERKLEREKKSLEVELLKEKIRKIKELK